MKPAAKHSPPGIPPHVRGATDRSADHDLNAVQARAFGPVEGRRSGARQVVPRTRHRHVAICAASLVLVVAVPASAQSLARRVEQAAPGTIRFSFAAQPGVCGDGESILRFDDAEPGRVGVVRGRNLRSAARWRGDDPWPDSCVFGPVIVTLDVRDRRFEAADVRVGDRAGLSGATELGHVPAQEAVDYLLEQVVRRAGTRAAQEVLLAAVLADSAEAWPALLDIGRDGTIPSDVRQNAIFWVGQAAADRATEGLSDLAGDDAEDIEVRKHALFALSQQRRDVGVPALIDIARTSSEPELVRTALFWLGQSRDDRALALFREILTRR